MPATSKPDAGAPTPTLGLSVDYDAVIFDMDGVIVDSEPRHERAFRDVLEAIGYADNHGIHFPDYYGKSDQLVWRDFIERHDPPHTHDELMQRREERFVEIVVADEPIFAGIPELVTALAKRAKLGVASGSRHAIILAVLGMKDLRRHFPVVVSSEDVPHGKPRPDIFLRAAELLNTTPQRCVVIEDSVAGVEAGLAAGMQVIAITNSFPTDALSRASLVVDTYDQIAAALAIGED